MSEPNHFEDPIVAKEWITAIETEESGSRDKEIYPFLSQWLQEIDARTIVEIGAGQGICSSKIDLASKRYIGIEPSTILVARARELYSDSSREFLEGNAYALPVADSSADAAFSVGVWFHIKDLDTAHKEAARILKRDGELMILTSNPTMDYLWESFFDEHTREGKVIEGKVRVPTGVLSKNTLYIHSKEELQDSLERNGFTIVSINTFGFGREGEKAYRNEGIWMAIRAKKKIEKK